MGYRALLAVSCRVCPVTGLLAAGGEPLGSATKICLVYNSVDDCVPKHFGRGPLLASKIKQESSHPYSRTCRVSG